MKKILLVCLCLLLLGCQDRTPSNNDEISLKYTEMENKLIEYGKLVYENEQWLNDEAKEITSSMTLNDLSLRNGYDISMFINPETREQCDLDKSRIEFIITDVSDLENIKYEFNPVLVCGDIGNINDETMLNSGEYDKLYNTLVDYMDNIYEDLSSRENLELGENKVTLRDLQALGYDISMFVNPSTGNQCNLDDTYGVIEILEIDNDGKIDYTFDYYIDCEK